MAYKTKAMLEEEIRGLKKQLANFAKRDEKLVEMEEELESLKKAIADNSQTVEEAESGETITITLSREEILAKAKAIGLFKHNRSLSRYEIIVPAGEFEKI